MHGASGTTSQRSGRRFNRGDDVSALTAFLHVEFHLVAGFDLACHGFVRQLEIHDHARPLQRRDRIVINHHLALGGVHALDCAGRRNGGAGGHGGIAVIVGFRRQGDATDAQQRGQDKGS